jgi:hypothetical protein
MTPPPANHHRRSIRIKGYDYRQNGAYFITLVTCGRQLLFGWIEQELMVLNEVGKTARDTWLWLAHQYLYVELGEFCVMPNHFHGILVINNQIVGAPREAPLDHARVKPLGELIGAYKTVSTKRINQNRNTPGVAL